MSSIGRCFSVVYFTVVVAIIGILAAVALPAYQDYTVRAKVSELVLAAANAKVTVAENAQTNAKIGRASCRERVKARGDATGGQKNEGTGVMTVAVDLTK